MRVLPTLQKQRHPLAPAAAQRRRLAEVPLARSFEASLAAAGLSPLAATGIEVLQINVGRKCNQTCRHCHVDAGPDRTEMHGGGCGERLSPRARPVRDPDARRHRGRARAAPGVPPHRRDGHRAGPPGDRPLQPHHHPAAQLPLDRPVPRPPPGRGHRVAAVLPGTPDRRPARRGRVRGVDRGPARAQRPGLRRSRHAASRSIS